MVVIKDNSKPEGVEGRYVEIEVSEVADKPLNDIMNMLNGRSDIVVKGYTRIVGYYSGVQNWNSSKVGELRDRANGNYGTPGFKHVHQNERIDTINNL